MNTFSQRLVPTTVTQQAAEVQAFLYAEPFRRTTKHWIWLCQGVQWPQMLFRCCDISLSPFWWQGVQ